MRFYFSIVAVATAAVNFSMVAADNNNEFVQLKIPDDNIKLRVTTLLAAPLSTSSSDLVIKTDAASETTTTDAAATTTSMLGHYGHPPDDCESDEIPVQIQGKNLYYPIRTVDKEYRHYYSLLTNSLLLFYLIFFFSKIFQKRNSWRGKFL